LNYTSDDNYDSFAMSAIQVTMKKIRGQSTTVTPLMMGDIMRAVMEDPAGTTDERLDMIEEIGEIIGYTVEVTLIPRADENAGIQVVMAE
jgi:hypothetical protein